MHAVILAALLAIPQPCPKKTPYPPVSYNRFGYNAAGFTRQGHYWSQAQRLLGRVTFQDIGNPALFCPPGPPQIGGFSGGGLGSVGCRPLPVAITGPRGRRF